MAQHPAYNPISSLIPPPGFYGYTPNNPERCPMCFKPFKKEENKPGRTLLNNTEFELLTKLEELVKEKKQFLENVRDILS